MLVYSQVKRTMPRVVDSTKKLPRIQSVLIDRKLKLGDARALLRHLGFIDKGVDVTLHYYRFRQNNPMIGSQMRTITLTRGVRAIYEY